VELPGAGAAGTGAVGRIDRGALLVFATSAKRRLVAKKIAARIAVARVRAFA
jgi:hypothetical protein